MPDEKSQLRIWLDRQSHLPKNIDEQLLNSFVHSCYNDLEKAKATLELFFTQRASSIDILRDRDPLSAHIQKALSVVNPAKYCISDDKILTVWQIADPGLEHYDHSLDIKLFYLVLDAWLLDIDKLSNGDIFILDVKDICPKLIATFNLSYARKLLKFCQEALPVRLQQVHLVNVPPFLDKVYAMVKPVLRKDIIDIIHFHLPMAKTLDQFLSKKDLPEDYGGNLNAIKLQKLNTISTLHSKRETLTQILWVASETKENETMDMGSFRTLSID